MKTTKKRIKKEKTINKNGNQKQEEQTNKIPVLNIDDVDLSEIDDKKISKENPFNS